MSSQVARVIAVAVAILSGAAACHRSDDLTNPQTIAEQLTGSWSELLNVPGASTRFTLSVSDTVIDGTGTFAIEAGPSGTLAVAGAIDDATVKLTSVSSIGLRQHFTGTLTAPNELRGALWTESPFSSDPVEVTFRRISP